MSEKINWFAPFRPEHFDINDHGDNVLLRPNEAAKYANQVLAEILKSSPIVGQYAGLGGWYEETEQEKIGNGVSKVARLVAVEEVE